MHDLYCDSSLGGGGGVIRKGNLLEEAHAIKRSSYLLRLLSACIGKMYLPNCKKILGRCCDSCGEMRVA
jgi:hypothetical protein